MIKKQFSIVIGRSKGLLIYLIILHSFMLAMVVLLLPNIWLLSITVITLLASFIYYCRCFQWLKGRRAINKLERDTKGLWKLFYSDKSSQEKLVLKHCVVTSKVVLLYFIGSSYWKAKSVTILRDGVDAGLFRQLRAYCRDPKTFLQ